MGVSITVNGNDAPLLAANVNQLTITDVEGTEADAAVLRLAKVIADNDLPPPDARLRFYWQGAPLGAGGFRANEVAYDSRSGLFTLRCLPFAYRKALQAVVSHSFAGLTIGQIVSAIASKHAMQAQVSDPLSTIQPKDAIQNNESTLQFLHRLAKDNNAEFTIKDETLILRDRHKTPTDTTTDKPLPALLINLDSADTWWSYTANLQQAYQSVIARWSERSVVFGDVQTITLGQGHPVYTLSGYYPSEKTATAAAKAALSTLTTRAKSLTIELPLKPEAVANQPIDFQPPHSLLDKTTFKVAKVTHRIGAGSVATTTIDAKPVTKAAE